MKKNWQKGFTLIELLVVIMIIGILAAIIVVSISNARSKSRDAKRLQDMQQIRTALELFYNQNGYYPTCEVYGERHCTTVGAFGDIDTIQLIPQFISKISDDPINATKDGFLYGYYYARGYIKTGTNTFIDTGLTTDYILGMRLENSSAPIYTGWFNDNLNWLTSSTVQ